MIVKPMDNLSVYGAYSVSYLPSSGDQFSSLTPGTLILQPQKFVNTEVGVKWNIYPKLLFSTAVYNLDRTNQPIADPNNAGFFLPSGSTPGSGATRASLTGYVTAAWQSSLAYAYTDARITSATSAHHRRPATAFSSCPTTSSPGGTGIRSTRDLGRGLSA